MIGLAQKICQEKVQSLGQGIMPISLSPPQTDRLEHWNTVMVANITPFICQICFFVTAKQHHYLPTLTILN